MWIHPLAACGAACGGKAAGLARLIGAGLRVPDGFAIDERAFRELAGSFALDDAGHALVQAAARIETAELPPELVAEVEAAARALGGPLAIRSSATIEDGEHGAAAGVFASRTGVALAELWPAVRAVWASALTPLAASYARGPVYGPTGSGRALSIAVIVQRMVGGERAVIYTRPPGEPDRDEMWIQRGDALARSPRSELAAQIEAAIGAPRGADVELVGDWIVQARPIVHRVPAARPAPPPSVLAILDDRRRWTWDVAHNPDPLSPAQAGLVEAIERAGIAPWSMRVCAGHLYTSPLRAPVPTLTLDEIEAKLAPLVAPAADLADAIARYLAFYELWANQLSPLVAAHRGTAPAARGERPSAVESTLLAAARGELTEQAALDRLGVLAPAWDVAVPTFAERPELVREAIARCRGIASPDPGPAGAADLGERDDLWFARAQWLVRAAILDRARELGIAAGDACWIPLDELASELDPIAAARKAAAHKAAAARAASWAMPVVVGGEPPEPGPALHGTGLGPRVTGRVKRFASLASAIAVGAGDVVVARAITPALAVLVVGCAAIVSETGGLLDHGAAMARELGITCVVGCRDAWTLLSDGMLVSVDGERGLVTY